MNIVTWLRSLGLKRTPADPDGIKHRRGWWVFVGLMLLLIAVLITVRSEQADAGTQVCRGPITGISPEAAGIGDEWVKLTASRWCGTGQRSSARFVSAPTWSRQYAEGLVWSFNRWFDTKSQTGYGTAPNGNLNVQYSARWVAAEFKTCIGVGPAQVCNHRTRGVRIWAWANGNYTVRSSSSTPNLPMPRP